jgi:hypothetical protein
MTADRARTGIAIAVMVGAVALVSFLVTGGLPSNGEDGSMAARPELRPELTPTRPLSGSARSAPVLAGARSDARPSAEPEEDTEASAEGPTPPRPRVEFVTRTDPDDPEHVSIESGRLVDGERDGLWTSRLPDGEIWVTTEYRKGRRHGTQTHYDEGRPFQTLEFADDLQHGPHRAYFPDGRLAMELEMVRGVQEGTTLNWHDNGHLRERSNWRAGKRDGVCTYWDREGEVLLKPSGTYEDGKKVAPHDPGNS